VPFGSKYHATYLGKFNLEKKGGNLVTDRMARTSHPRIFAIGALAATQIWRDIRRSATAFQNI
jgi:thioredoxin reductase (NADPH)